MRYFRALLSAFTFFGGHVLNRRLDRLVAVFAALATVGIVSYLVLPTLIFNALDTGLMDWALRAPALLIIATAIASAVLTWVDAKAPPAAPLSAGSMIAGGIVSVLGLFVLWLTTVSLLSVRVAENQTPRSAQSQPPPSLVRRTVYTSVHLGGHASSDRQEPPAGPHPLRGRIVLDGKPVYDAEVQLALNGAFETDMLSTDRRGEFSARLPAGKWSINRVTLGSPGDAPEGRVLLLFSAQEPTKGTGNYSRYDFSKHTGLEFRLPLPADSVVPTFELRDAIHVEWPMPSSRVPDESKPAPAADAANSAITWTPVTSAAEYEIQLSSITRESHTTSYHPILRRRQAQASLRLADLPQRPAESQQAGEYAVTIYAFDSSGKLLTQSDDRFGELAFSLASDVRLAEEPFAGSTLSGNTERFRDMERLSLIAGLLEHKQIDAARAILAEVGDDAPPGRKAAMQGAVEALSGNCAAALPLFDKADEDGGLGCAPLKYRRLCSGK